MWEWCVLIWLAASLLIYFVSAHRGWYSEPCLGNARTLFVTAHPDDECMFFAPAILSLTEKHPECVFLLCMSCGNYRKEGHRRISELFASARELGIPPEHVTVVNSSYFPDDPKARWDLSRLANTILYHVESLGITVIVTFDESGVSGHSNHQALSDAMHEMKIPDGCRVFCLDTVGLVRKYMAFLDVLPSLLTGLFVHISSLSRRRRAVKAMAEHSSQMVWFRKLYLVFSRYMLVNTFTEMTDELSL